MPEEFKILNYAALDEELRNYVVALVDPSEFPTSKINKKLIRIQGYKDRVLGMMFDAINNKNMCEKRHNEMISGLERDKEFLMAKDPEIKDLAQKKAEATTNLRLKDKLDTLLLMENILLDAKSYESRVRIAYDNLESTYKAAAKLIGNIQVMFVRGEMKMVNNASGIRIEEE